ncbi:hypothetical protein G9A89_014761 [Geosiphon pyriformis]|nr:hypothetical protein G9A89_014761 [Geosiphon pyriformis]
MVKKTKSSEKWKQLLASAIVTLNPFVVSNEILDEIFIVSSSTLSKMGQDQPLVVLSNMMSSGRSLLVLEAKQSLSIGLPVFGNWADQMETESSPPLIKLAHVKAVFQLVHGFLGAKSVLKNNVKLFCVEFTSQVFLKAAFLVELTSSVHLATLKIAKFLVISESGSLFAAITLHDVPLGVSATDIKIALNVFGIITHVVLKPISIWQYVVIHFEKLDSAISALNYWSVLVSKNSVRILSLVNQNETILSCDKFKAKLVNLSPGCTVFKISDMISQIGGQTCFIPQFSDSGHHLHFALVTFGFQADLDLAVAKTGTLRKCCIWWKTSNCRHCFWCQEIGYLAVDCEVALSPFLKTPKMFKLCFVGSLFYAKVFVSSVMSEFLPLVASAPPVTIVDPAVGFRLNSLEKQISDLAALVKSIVEPVGSLVALVFCFLDDNTVKAV